MDWRQRNLYNGFYGHMVFAANTLPPQLLQPFDNRDIFPNQDGSLPLRRSYDYIVVGSGIGGLVVANRLSEDASVSVLLIEAGELDDRAEDVTVPGNIGQEDPVRYEWSMTTTPQEFLDNQTRTFPQGKAVGGSSIMNGMCWTRGSAPDYDAWRNLGNPGWGWSDLLPYFLKSENYTMHSNVSLQDSLRVVPAHGAHNNRGPVEVGFSRYIYNQTYNFLRGIQELGIPITDDLNTGDGTGASLVPASLAASNQSRSDARVAYFDPVASRDNFELLTSHTVTRILADVARNWTSHTPPPGPRDLPGRVVARGVEIAADSTGPRYNVSCRREVIVAAGAISSPVLLQISGFGPAEYLRNIGVDVLVDLPGVGSNLQDHPMVQPEYLYTAPDVFSARDIVGDMRESVKAEYFANRTGPWTATMVNAVAFPAFNEIEQVVHLITNETDPNLPSTYDDSLRAGYATQQREVRALLSHTDVPAYELMATSWGQLAVSVMHMLSRGTVRARSSSIFDDEPPIIDSRLCSHPFDCEILRLGLELNDRLIATDAMTALLPVPPAGLGTQDLRNRTALMDTLKGMVHTEFHPSGTAAMMPRDVGGVVDTELRVYGTKNLRVVDASIMPLIPSGHIQAAVYAIAEKAADIIKSDYRRNNPAPEYSQPLIQPGQ
ncbi:GMC oxidoreductase-domain-containing protein [Astrocystis sublimbata]|nr:GMC oxidoreductase-domain-containing protein [Astrocystis sublimbata]